MFSAELLMLEPYSVIACVLAFVLDIIVLECYHFDYNVDQTETVIISNRFIAYEHTMHNDIAKAMCTSF